MNLVEPNVDCEASYLSYLSELGDGARIPFTLTYPHQPFAELVQRLADQSHGIGLREGFVPNSTYWLVDGGEIVGVSNLRHRLTPNLMRIGGHIGYGVRPSCQGRGVGKELLRLTLDRAAERGIWRALLTCGSDNRASAGIILANRGRLENEFEDPESGETIQRYWIDVDVGTQPADGKQESEARCKNLRIARLSEYPEHLETAVDWIASEWEPAHDAIRKMMADSEDRPPALLALNSNVPVGVLAYKIHAFQARGTDELWLNALYVEPKFRRRGIGQRLVLAGLQDAEASGRQSLLVYTDISHFYERLGWRRVSCDEKTKTSVLEYEFPTLTPIRS